MRARLRCVALLGAVLGTVAAPNCEALHDIIMVDQLRPDAGRGVVDKMGLAGLFEVPAMETSVTEDGALHIKQGSAWRLLLAFLAPGGVAGQDNAVQRLAETVGELELQSAQRARIEASVVEALRKAGQRDMQEQHNSPISIRVWIQELSTTEPRSNIGARKARAQTHRGWGFFLLERQEDTLQTPQVESHRVIEVYLYQERAEAKKGKQP